MGKLQNIYTSKILGYAVRAFIGFLTCSGCYLGIYAGLGGIQSIFTFISAISLAVAGVLAAQTLHSKLLRNILRCPISFFDTTPLGRVLNRFSLDIYVIDKAIPSLVQLFLYRVLSTLGVILVISVATPIFVAVIIPLGFFFCVIQVRKRMIHELTIKNQSGLTSLFEIERGKLSNTMRALNLFLADQVVETVNFYSS